MTDLLQQAAAALRVSKSTVVLTGAGISAESGIPTFRDALTGHWAKFKAEDLATPQAFARDPAMVSRWYDQRRLQIADCRPNAGHIAIAQIQKYMDESRTPKTFVLVTQNVDRLHQAAGSHDVMELHGTLWAWRCLTCGKETEERGPAFDQYPPTCPCGGIRRPGVVWFGEALPRHALAAATKAARSCDLFLSVGTSSVVYPAAGLIEDAAAEGAQVLEINPAATPLSDQVTWSIRGAAGQVLPRLVEMAFGSE